MRAFWITTGYIILAASFALYLAMLIHDFGFYGPAVWALVSGLWREITT